MKRSYEKMNKLNSVLGETAGLYRKLNILLDLSDSVSDILYLLYANDGCYPVRGLCMDLDIPKQTVNSALRRLEKEDILLLETISGKKKRAVLTEKGKQFCDNAIAPIFQIENSVFAEFSPSELETFITLHEKYNAVLGRHINDYGRAKNGREQ